MGNGAGHQATWRRKWKRSSREQRRAAARSLHDLFQPIRFRTLLPMMLPASVILHGAIAVCLAMVGTAAVKQVGRSEDTYLRKVVQKDRAKHVAANVSQRTTLPPPPPDQE